MPKQSNSKPGSELRPESIRAMLLPGVRLASGRVPEVIALVQAEPKHIAALVECLWDDDAGVANRAADVLERITHDAPAHLSRLQRYKEPLLGLLSEATENKLRWNLAFVLPRLTLTREECRRAAATLQTYLEDKSSIVRTAALQAFADLTRQDPASLPAVLDLLRVTGRSGTAAMRARSRILLKRLEKSPIAPSGLRKK